MTVVIGILRFKNQFTFLHIAAVNDMFCVPLMGAGCLFYLCHVGLYFVALKAFLLLVFFMVSNPIVSYCMAKILHDYKKIPEDKSN